MEQKNWCPRPTRVHLVMQSTGLCNFRVRASSPKMEVGTKNSGFFLYYYYIYIDSIRNL